MVLLGRIWVWVISSRESRRSPGRRTVPKGGGKRDEISMRGMASGREIFWSHSYREVFLSSSIYISRKSTKPTLRCNYAVPWRTPKVPVIIAVVIIQFTVKLIFSPFRFSRYYRLLPLLNLIKSSITNSTGMIAWILEIEFSFIVLRIIYRLIPVRLNPHALNLLDYRR